MQYKYHRRGFMKTVKDIMSYPVFTIDKDATIQDAARVMADKNIGALTVMEGEELIGIITERDISKRIVAENRNPSQLKVKEMMHSPIVTAKPAATIYDAFDLMSAGGFRRLPLVEDGKLVGIVTQTDVELALHAQAIEETSARTNERQKFSEMLMQQEAKIADLKRIVTKLETVISK